MPVFDPEGVAALRAKAARLEAQATPLCAEYNRMRGDIAWLTQPARGTAFGNRRSRAMARYDKGCALIMEARQLSERADRLEQNGRQTAGDAEAARVAKAAALDAVLSVGSRVGCRLYGSGFIERVHPKSYKIRFDRGFTINVQKQLCTTEEVP